MVFFNPWKTSGSRGPTPIRLEPKVSIFSFWLYMPFGRSNVPGVDTPSIILIPVAGTLCFLRPARSASPPMETFACTDSDASSGAPPLLFASDLCLSLRLLTGRATLLHLYFALGSSSCTNIIIIPVDRFELALGTLGNGVLFSGTQKFSAPIACTTLAVH